MCLAASCSVMNLLSSQDPDVAGRPSLASLYTGVEDSLQLAAKAIAEHQPLDGFLGTTGSRLP